MNDSAEGKNRLNIKTGLGAGMVLVIIAVVSLWLFLRQDAEHQLMPFLPSATPPTPLPQEEPELIAFTELNDNPLAYLNQRILVSGDYLPVVRADCLDIVGPDIRWSLTGDNLQLDALGFERIVQLLPVETTMTVEGIWRLYQGPLGCGKGPPRGSMWYLETKKIVQPNPLVSAGGQTISVEIRNGTPELPSTVLTESESGAGPTATDVAATPTSGSNVIASPTLADQIIPTQTPPLPSELTPSATATQFPTVNGPTNTPTPNPNSTITATIEGATAVPTNDPAVGTPTVTTESPQLPATATETNGGGYPGPEGTATLTPTATQDPYP